MHRNRLRRLEVIAVLLALGVAAAGGQAGTPAQASASDETAYTYIATWSVPRGDWSVVEKYFASVVPAMTKLTDSGTIQGWGHARAFVHDDSGVTHINWFTAGSFAGLAKALDGIRAAGTPPPAFGNAKHRDSILRSTVNGHKVGATGSGMLWVGEYELHGQAEEFSQMFVEEIKPLFEEQLAAKVVLAYSLNFEAVHTGSPNQVSIAYLLPDAAAIDKFQAALEGYETKHPRAGAAMEAAMNLAAHRDMLFEVLAFGQK